MLTRRELICSLSAAALAPTSLSGFAMQSRVDDADRQTSMTRDSSPVRLGVIGPGSRGKELVRSLLRVPGVQITAAADVYDPRFDQLDAVCGYKVARHTDYRALCDRKDLDAIVVATPLGLHGAHALAAIESGHHVYCEKTMTYRAEESDKLVAAVAKSKKIFQAGHQYRYSPWIRAALARVAQGEIGTVTHIQGYWHRNNDWRRPVPAQDPGGKLEHLINWRLYHPWSLGLIAELATHHIDLANWILDANPTTAIASGSICTYHDGRETDDNVQVVLGYPGGRRFIFTSMLNNAMRGDQLWVYGTKGSLNLTLQDATFYYEPAKVTKPASAGKNEEKGVTTTASYRPGGEMPYRGPGKPVDVTTAEDPTTAATRAFIYCVRNNAEPVSNVHIGRAAALAVIQANKARYDGKQMEIPA